MTTSSTSSEILAAAARLAATPSTSSLRRSSIPAPVTAEVTMTGTSCRFSVSSSLRRSATQSSACAGSSRSDWFNTTASTSEWLASGTRNRLCTAASAYFCGSSTQTMTSALLTSWSTSSPAWLITESWSGRSSSTSPARSSSPLSSALARENLWRGGTSSQSRIAPEPACPQTHACASLVTGLVTPTVEKSAPATQLNNDDLPLPVPPASTTTVWLDESRIRSPARASTSSASASSFSLNPSLPLLACPIWIILASAISRADRPTAASASAGASSSAGAPGSTATGWAAASSAGGRTAASPAGPTAVGCADDAESSTRRSPGRSSGATALSQGGPGAWPA